MTLGLIEIGVLAFQLCYKHSFVCLETVSYVAQAGLELSMRMRVTLNFRSFCFPFLGAGRIGTLYHIWFIQCWG